MAWVDTHCHLQLDDRDPDELLARAPQVDWVLVPGIDAASSAAAARLSHRLGERVSWSAGLHPHDAARWPEESSAITELAAGAHAVGETGLDFYRDLSPRPRQEEAFRAQLRLAVELGKPAIVHCRDAFAAVHAALEETGAGPNSVLHCWTGGRRWARRFLELGVMFSFAGPVAFETGETVRRAAAVVPPQRALVETDTPYLSPPPFRHLPNEPARVALVGAALAEVWGMEVEEVATVTGHNAVRVFRP